jgi:uncharacterized membrane protein YfcA
MKQRWHRLIRIGAFVWALKILLGAVVLLAIWSAGIPRLQTLWLGVEVLPVNATIREQFGVSYEGGALVNWVYEHSPAEEARLQRGDVVLNVDNRPVYGAEDIKQVIADRDYKDRVRIIYMRNGLVFFTKAVLDYRAVNVKAAAVRPADHYSLTFDDFVALMILGLIAGTLSGMIGCGGGVLKVSLLVIFFGFEIFLAKVVSLVSCGFMSLSSSFRYIKRNQADRLALKYLIPSSLVGVLGGILVSMLLSRHVLEITLGIFLVYAALDIAYEAYSARKKRMEPPAGGDVEGDGRHKRGPSSFVFAGFPLGVVSAVLGITGGVVGTPLQRLLTKAPIRTCIANTLVTVIFVSFLGGLLLLVEGLVRDRFSFETFAKVLVSIAPGSVIGGQLGSALNTRLPLGYVKGIYAIVVLLIAVKILLSV